MWRSRCRGVSGLLGPAGGFQVDLRLSHGIREVGVAPALKNSMAELLTGGGMLCLSFEGSGVLGLRGGAWGGWVQGDHRAV